MCEHEWQVIANDGKQIKYMCFRCQGTKDEEVKRPPHSVTEKIKEYFKASE